MVHGERRVTGLRYQWIVRLDPDDTQRRDKHVRLDVDCEDLEGSGDSRRFEEISVVPQSLEDLEGLGTSRSSVPSLESLRSS